MIAEKIDFNDTERFDLFGFRDETIGMLADTLLVVNRFESTLDECFDQYPEVYGELASTWRGTLSQILGDNEGKEVLRAARDVLRTYRHSVDNWKAKMEKFRQGGLDGLPDEFFMMRDLSKALLRNGYNEVKACGWKRELFADVVMARQFVEGYLAAVSPLIKWIENELSEAERAGGIPIGTFMKKYERREKNAESARAS